MSEVRGRSWKDPMSKGWRPRGVTPRLRLGQQPRVPGCDGAGTAKKNYPTSEVRGSGQEELPHVQGVVAAQAQEGLVDLFHVEGQEGRQ